MLRKIIIVVLILCGIAVLAYPWAAQWYANQSQDVMIQNYQDSVDGLSPEQAEAEYQKAVAYNQRLIGGLIVDPFEGDPPTAPVDYVDILNFGDFGTMATLEIPAIALSSPVVHGVTEEALQAGIGHIPTTALPIGGKGTHSVLVGHRGLPLKKLFTNLDVLKEGDLFYIHVLNHHLAYRVDQIRVVLPTDTSDLQPVAGEDYVTLVTCTPYGINSHRLLVRGTRTPYVPPPDKGFPNNLSAADRKLLLAAAITLAVVLVLMLVAWAVRRRRERRQS